MSARARGMQAIKTLSAVRGTGAHSNERHVHQFQLASLELEHTRLGREKEAAFQRIGDIDARLAEIDHLIDSHQEALGLQSITALVSERRIAKNPGGEAVESRRVLRY